MPKKKRFRSHFQGDNPSAVPGTGGSASRPRLKKPRRRYGPNYQQAFANPEDGPGENALNEDGEAIVTEDGEAPPIVEIGWRRSARQ